MKQAITAVINTKNSANTLERTLKSLKFCNHVVVVDMHSADDTVKIAKRFTDKVYSHPDVGYVEPARNFAIKKSMTDWVLIVDSDEVIPDLLAKKIQELLSAKADVSCYFIARQNIIFGKWIEKTGWWPDFQPRLFKKNSVTWKDEVHSTPSIDGNIEYLPAQPELSLVHYNYESVSDYLLRLDRYTGLAALESDEVEYTAAEVVKKFKQELLKRLFEEKGLEEGIHGVGLSFLQSMYQLVTYLKAWEQHNTKDSTHSVDETMAEIEALSRDLHYWIANYHANKSKGFKGTVWKARRKFKI